VSDKYVKFVTSISLIKVRSHRRIFKPTYQCLVSDFILLGISDDGPLEEPSFIIKLIFVDVAFSVLRLLTYLLLYGIALLVGDHIKTSNVIPTRVTSPPPPV
jgi:hypothetical protein